MEAAPAAAYVAILGLATGALNMRKVFAETARAAATSVMIFTLSGLPDAIVSTVSEFGLSKFSVVIAMALLYLVLGTVLEAMSMMLITVPVLFPITPPIWITIFTIAGIGKIDIRRIALQIVPFLPMILALMFVVIFVEGIAT